MSEDYIGWEMTCLKCSITMFTTDWRELNNPCGVCFNHQRKRRVRSVSE